MNRMTTVAASTAIVGAGLFAGSGLASAGEYDKYDRTSTSTSTTHNHVHYTDKGTTPAANTGLVGGLLGGLGGTVDGLLTDLGGTVDGVLGV